MVEALDASITSNTAALSEESVKRMFSRRDSTLRRMEEVCHITGIELAGTSRGSSPLSRQVSPSDDRRAIANAYGQRGTYMSCDYRMTTPYQGTGTCDFPPGRNTKVHIGG
jgi:hypothetical protein